jgi:N-acetylneuraminate synthase
MCGGSADQKRRPPDKEIKYLDALVRGVYAKRDLPEGYVLNHDTMYDDLYLAIPLQKGQISCRELMSGETLQLAVKKDHPITIDAIDSAYAYSAALKDLIMQRGL